MIRFLADENFNNKIIRGVLRRFADADILRVQDVGLAAADDPTVLEWAAGQSRLLLTHDAATMTAHAYARVEDGKGMPGVIEVGHNVQLAQAIEDILLLLSCSDEGEWEGQILYLPLTQ